MTDQPARTRGILRTTTSRTCLPLRRDAVRHLVGAFATRTWNCRVVVAEHPGLLVLAVGVDSSEDPDGWLTWTFEELSADDTRVTVSLSEQDDGAPEPELDLLVSRLVAAAVHPGPHDMRDPAPTLGKESS